MKVFTPGSLARHADSKYLGVLVAAKYARGLNEFRRGQILDEAAAEALEPQEKLTTIALEEVVRGDAPFRLVERVRAEEL